MSTDEGDFLKRWARRKREAALKTPVEKAAETPAAELPPIDSLTFDSDFSAFLRANVDEKVKRAALKKLLHDPRFNVMDGLDTYIDDYTRNEGVSEEMLKTLEHARSTLFPPQASEPAQTPAEAQAKAEEQAPNEENGDPRQDA